jgi:hypothetical protein
MAQAKDKEINMEYEATKKEAARIRKQIDEISDADLVTVSIEMYDNGLENLAEFIQKKAKSINFLETPF